MKKLYFTVLFAVLTIIFSFQTFASSGHDSHESGHGSRDMDHSKTMEDGHGGHGDGIKIHTSGQDGYSFEYRLIDMKEKMKHMKHMPEMKDTHHLMVYVKDAHGMAVKTAKVGYLIQEKGSDVVQKKMAMAMNNGFGADVTFDPNSHYTIKTKVMAGDTKLMDEFNYTGGSH